MTVRRWFRTSNGRWATVLFGAVIAVHLSLRGTGWTYEWLKTVLIVTFACVFLGPLAAGIGAIEGGRWARVQLPRVVDRSPSSTGIRAWAVLVAWLLVPIPAALVVAGAFAKARGLPGLPSAGDLASLLAAEGMVVGWATIGFAFGWRARAHVVVAPLVAGLAFAATVGLWGSRWMIVNTGGTFASLVGLGVSVWVTRAQLVFWFGATIGALALLADRRQVRLAALFGLAGVVAMVTGAQLGTRADGLTFAPRATALHCEPVVGDIPLCLAPGYEARRAATARDIEEAFGPWRHFGLPLPRRITQDSNAFGSGTMWLAGSEVVHPRVGAFQRRLVQSLIPTGCDPWNQPEIDRAVSRVAGTIVTDPLPHEVLPAGVDGPDPKAALATQVAIIRSCRTGQPAG